MIQKSMEYAGPQQHTGESPVFVHCLVIKIELLFLMSFTKCDACTKHDAIMDGIRKNIFI